MNIMTKRGSLDNIITYEHICDTTADMNNINPNYITLGSTCIVLNNDDNAGMDVYIANSEKTWKPIAASMIGGSNNSNSNNASIEVFRLSDNKQYCYSERDAADILNDFDSGKRIVFKFLNSSGNGYPFDQSTEYRSSYYIMYSHDVYYSSDFNKFIDNVSHIDVDVSAWDGVVYIGDLRDSSLVADEHKNKMCFGMGFVE